MFHAAELFGQNGRLCLTESCRYLRMHSSKYSTAEADEPGDGSRPVDTGRRRAACASQPWSPFEDEPRSALASRNTYPLGE